MVGRFVLLAVLSAGAVFAEPLLSRSVVHERRTVLPQDWAAVGAPAPGAALRMRLGLAQRNMDRLDEYLLDVSHPESENYGKHWTPTQVAKAFAPSDETVDVVRSWLGSAGIDPARVRATAGNVWLELNATVAEAESLLATTYNVYGHESGAQKIGARDMFPVKEPFSDRLSYLLGCDKYHLPEHVSRLVDIVTPTVHFDAKITRRGLNSHPKGATGIGQPGAGIASPKQVGASFTHLIDELKNCDT